MNYVSQKMLFKNRERIRKGKKYKHLSKEDRDRISEINGKLDNLYYEEMIEEQEN
mgnify:FL=1